MTSSSTGIRIRFAPSLIGFLHIGGARTALFNWLFARHIQGTFVLRIEDTDEDRSTEESVHGILESMVWLGLDWAEGPKADQSGVIGHFAPHFQMQRLDKYQAACEELV